MEEAIEKARSKDTKERMAAVEHLHRLLEASRKTLTPSEVTSLVDCCLDLLKDNNFRVSQGGLLALASAAVLSGENLKLHFNAVVPAVVERLGDGKQPVRDSARRLLLTLMEVSSPTIIVERAGSYAWAHRSWRVREEFARTVTSAIALFASTELPLQRAILPHILQMLNDSNQTVREAAIACIEEMYTHVGPQFRDELQRHQLPVSMMKEINLRLERIQPKVHVSDGPVNNYTAVEVKPASHKRSSPKAKSSTREVTLFGGDNDVTEKPVDPIKVYSEKELIREFEKIALILVPEKDWSLRIGAMQRFEALVLGGATDYPCFRGLLKQLAGPLSTQLSDRRSSIVKQACHLLNFLSKELLGDFEACAEIFIPVLFKLVVITVLVIAESADNCIKTMLRNCKVARVLPRIADCAKNDRNAVLRARCCDYALLILECWPDEPEIQRAADLYEDLIRCCVADAMSEVRATARTCYRMFSRTWPERSRRLFSSFDPVIQRVLNDEDGGIHRRQASPSLRDRSSQHVPQTLAPSNFSGYSTSAIVTMDRGSNLSASASLSSGVLSSQSQPIGKNAERSLESVLHASKQKVTAIESMLRGLDVSNGMASRSSSLDLGVDPPSSRDPPYPFAVPASHNLVSSLGLDTTTSGISKGNNRNGGLAMTDIITQIRASRDANKSSYPSTGAAEPSPALLSYSARRGSERLNERGYIEGNTNTREERRFMNMDKQYLDVPHREPSYRDSHNSHIPHFQRPLSRKHVAGRMSPNRRSFDSTQTKMGEMSNYIDGPASLLDALSQGLNHSADWNARVAAFNYLHSLLQQGPKGIQEVTQNFEKVMKLFFQHLDDPHHKVAQAALSTLADIIPACRKPFESYMERILPHVFSRLIDPKELVRQPCSATLEVVSKSYGADSLLPAMLRSLDEQRSPKAKLAVIEFAISSFKKNVLNPEGCSNFGILKLWLAKLTPLVHDKNTKLKEAAITCMISVYSHFDSAAVLNYILGLSIEEQNSLRRALKKNTPRIEVDLMNFLQNKKERQRTKSSFDQSDVVGTSSEDGCSGISRKSHLYATYSGGFMDSDGGKKWSSRQEPQVSSPQYEAASGETQERYYQGYGAGVNSEVLSAKTMDFKYMGSSMESIVSMEASSSPRLDVNEFMSSEPRGLTANMKHENEVLAEMELNHGELPTLSINTSPDSGLSIPKILHLISNGNDESAAASKHDALQQLVEASVVNDQTVWTKYFNQILTVVLEVLDDSESTIRELALSLIIEMLKNQKDIMEDSVEIVIEKLLHVTKDIVPKVANDAVYCLTIVLSQYDPFRCLTVIVPLLVTEDEKTLVACINCLTKLVGRLSQEELIAQLPSFLPSLFEAFGSQSADVRKTVVFCLVDIYIILGKTFLPYMEGLNSTQLRLVTIYANRISVARTGASIDANNG